MDVVVENLCKSFGDKVVLDNFNATFPAQKRSSITAPSGRGKTTLFKIMLGLVEKDRGDIFGIDGKNIVAVFQEDRLCENLSAVVNISIATDIDQNSIVDALEDIGLDDSIYHPVSTLSGGMKRRVAILRAVLSNADIILLDEPFKGLDDDVKKKTIQLIKKHTSNKTVILITHLSDEITELGCENNIIM